MNQRISFSATGWARRLGLAGFAFFFAKGMLWLFLPILARHLLR